MEVELDYLHCTAEPVYFYSVYTVQCAMCIQQMEVELDYLHCTAGPVYFYSVYIHPMKVELDYLHCAASPFYFYSVYIHYTANGGRIRLPPLYSRTSLFLLCVHCTVCIQQMEVELDYLHCKAGSVYFYSVYIQEMEVELDDLHCTASSVYFYSTYTVECAYSKWRYN